MALNLRLLHVMWYDIQGKVSVQFSSEAQSCLTLWPHGLQHASLPCPSPTPGVYSSSCPLSWSVMPSNHLTLCCPLLLPPLILPSIGLFSNESVLCIRWPTIGVSVSALVLPVTSQDWFPLGCTGWISMQSKGLSRDFFNTTVQKHQLFCAQLSLYSNSHIHTWLLEKTKLQLRWTFAGKVMSVLFNMLSRFIIAFLPRSKCL